MGVDTKGRWQEGKFTTLLEIFDSQDCVPKDNQCRYADEAAAKPQKAPGPLTPSLKGRQALRQLLTPFYGACVSEMLIRRHDVCLDTIPLRWGLVGSQPRLRYPLLLTRMGMGQENPRCSASNLEVPGKN